MPDDKERKTPWQDQIQQKKVKIVILSFTERSAVMR